MNTLFSNVGYIGVIFLLCISGAIWRYWDGIDGVDNTGVFKIFQHTLARLSIAVLISVSATSYGIGWIEWPLISLLTTSIAVLSLHMGYTKWENGEWQMLRFGIPASIIGALAVTTGTSVDMAIFYTAACAAAGWSYSKIDEELARLPMGATLGLLSLL